MYKLENLENDLKNKKRTINDLIRFIKTRNDENPNYSLLLGAGTSVTSGINSAGSLIKKWEVEIVQNEYNINNPSEEDIKKYFDNSSNLRWYDQRNKYSSLFEKKYDLPRQRRMFIEKEVRDKIPAIGYSYLIKLIERNYFKTIFTTNFDDLINEAFYLYSNKRPIVCAHDSAISSITVTSKRPKIIKLHGDYLFDDIKSTLRETESLEENIKNKFIEFAKDYGLIVIGYGGNDRSIIDVLTYLLKNEEYFKNGIYWCLRSDSEINEDLRKLLWKERVYYVNIDGFDELMAELNENLNDGELPIDSNILNNQKINLIKGLTNNVKLKESSSEIIQKDLKLMGIKQDKDVVENFFNYISIKEDDNESDKFSIIENDISLNYPDSEKFLTQINELIFSDQYESALKKVDFKLDSVQSSSKYYVQLLYLKARCLRKLDKNNSALEIYNQLIELEPWYYKNYLIASQLSLEVENKLKIIDQGIKSIQHESDLYLEKAKILFSEYLECYCFNNESLKKILNILETCTKLSPSINNEAWSLKFAVFKKQLKNKAISIENYESLIEILSVQDPTDPVIVDNIVFIHKEKKEKDLAYNYLVNLIIESHNIEYTRAYELIYLNTLAYFGDLDKLRYRFNFIESKYKVDRKYLSLKAELTLDKLKELKNSISILENISNKNKNIYSKLFTYYLYDGKYDKAKEILETNLGNDKEDYCQLLQYQGKYEEALELIPDLKKQYSKRRYDIQESFICLKLNKNKKVETMTGKILKENHFSDPYLLINYWIAKQRINKKLYTEKIKDKIFNKISYSKTIQSAAYALIEDYDNAYKILKEQILEDYSTKYVIKDWIVFEKMFKKDKYKSLLD